MSSNPDLVIRAALSPMACGELFQADVAIIDGRIVEVGRVLSKGKEEIDARQIGGAGFVDLHTHYDGQSPGARTSHPRRRMASPPPSWAIAGSASRPAVRRIING